MMQGLDTQASMALQSAQTSAVGQGADRSAGPFDVGSEHAELEKAARQFEALFGHMLLKSMRAATRAMGDNAYFGSFETHMYEDMLDERLARHLSENQSLGLADVLVRQLSAFVNPKRESGLTPGTAPGEVRGADAPASARGADFPDKAAFVGTLLPAVRPAAAQLGVAPELLVAQAALETGWGRNVIRGADGASSHNLFGIKARSSAEPQVMVSSVEVINGTVQKVRSPFRVYADYAEAAADFAGRVGADERYGPLRGAGGDADRYADALAAGGYATDPQYADKIRRIAADPLLGGR